MLLHVLSMIKGGGGQGVQNVYLPMKWKAWEVLVSDRGGWELLNRSLEASERHARGGGEGVTRRCVCRHEGGL